MPQPPAVPVADPIQPGEVRTYSFNFTEFPEIKDAAETISGAGSVAASPSGLTLATPAIATGSKKVNVKVTAPAAVAAGTYRLTLSGVTTSGGHTLEGEFDLPVKNL